MTVSNVLNTTNSLNSFNINFKSLTTCNFGYFSLDILTVDKSTAYTRNLNFQFRIH